VTTAVRALEAPPQPRASPPRHALTPAPAPRTRIAAGIRLLPAFAVLFTFGVLARGGFSSLAALGPHEAVAAALLLAGAGIATVRRLRRSASGAEALLRDELELGGCALAAAFAAVALAG
jgi:hypothetical protein